MFDKNKTVYSSSENSLLLLPDDAIEIIYREI